MGPMTKSCSTVEDDQIVKVTEYVERPYQGPLMSKDMQLACKESVLLPLHWRFFVTLETGTGEVIVTERLKDGTMKWADNPPFLEARISLAKTARSADCCSANITVGDM